MARLSLTVALDPDLVDQLRVTVAALQRQVDPHISLAGFVADAIGEQLAQVHQTYNDGEPFTATGPTSLPVGRRLSS